MSRRSRHNLRGQILSSRPGSRAMNIEEFSSFMVGHPDDILPLSNIVPECAAIFARPEHIRNTKPPGHSPLKVRKTRANVCLKAPAPTRNSGGSLSGMLKSLAPRPGALRRGSRKASNSSSVPATSFTPSSMSNLGKKENNAPPESAIEAISASTIDAKMLNFTTAMLQQTDVRSSEKTPHIARHRPRRSLSESNQNGGLSQRVITQVKNRLRKPSKQEKLSSTSRKASGDQDVDAASSKPSDADADWASTIESESTAPSIACSSRYSRLQENDMLERSASHDGVTMPSALVLSTSQSTTAQSSRMSTVFTPGKSPTKSHATAGTSLYSSPSRQFMKHEAPYKSYTGDHPNLTLRASVHVASTIEAVHFAEASELWAAITVRGEVVDSQQNNANMQQVSDGSLSLAVAIVIDNSMRSSPTFLEKACRQILTIANLLRGRGDHLAIYTTGSVTGNARLNDYEVCPLSAPDFTVIRRELNTLLCAETNVQQSPEINYAVTQATESLRRLDFARDHDVRTAARAVILMAPHTADYKQQLSGTNLGDIQLHFISPSVIPSQANSDFSYSTFVNSFLAQSNNLKEDETEEAYELRVLSSLLMSARYNGNHGNIPAISIDVMPGPETKIIEIVGNQYPVQLLPGETVSILTRLRVQKMDQIGIDDDLHYRASSSGFTISRAFNAVESVLQELIRELVTVRVTYHHSHFPQNTSLNMTEVCWIRRPAYRITKNRTASQQVSSQKCIAAQKAVILRNVIRCELAEALGELELERLNWPDVNQEFLDMVSEELQHQMNTEEAALASDTFERPLFAGYSPTLKEKRSQLEINTSKLRQNAMRNLANAGVVNREPPRMAPYPDAPPAGLRTSTAPTSPLPRSLTTRQVNGRPVSRTSNPSSDDSDPARRFWRQMRQVSKGKDPDVFEEDVEEKIDDEHFNERVLRVRQQALANRRSIGNDTLRSMARSMNRLDI